MKKIFLSISLIAASVLYVLFGSERYAALTAASDTPTPLTPPEHTPPPVGTFKDGSYTGTLADAYYGNIQVRAIIQNGALNDVELLDYPSHSRTSEYINGRALPELTSEAIAAQNAKVDIVSGATQTSKAFRESLAAALAQAK
jgi:uncharacterized protein with FMN-binding domain